MARPGTSLALCSRWRRVRKRYPQQQDEQKDEEGKEQDQQEQKEDKEVEALLKKAQERNDEHEADKKARMRKAPLPPNERDW